MVDPIALTRDLVGIPSPTGEEGQVVEEYTGNAVHRKGTLPVANFSGSFVSASTLLFGGRFRYDTISGEFTQPSRGRSWGDVEIAARYEYLDLIGGGISGGTGEATTIGLN